MNPDMRDPARLREWLMRNYYLQEEMKAFPPLSGGLADDIPYENKRALFCEAAACRMEIYDFLKGCTLKPREMEVVRQHCIQCKSWNEIARFMKKDRRYLIRVFGRAVRRLAQQVADETDGKPL